MANIQYNNAICYNGSLPALESTELLQFLHFLYEIKCELKVRQRQNANGRDRTEMAALKEKASLIHTFKFVKVATKLILTVTIHTIDNKVYSFK